MPLRTNSDPFGLMRQYGMQPDSTSANVFGLSNYDYNPGEAMDASIPSYTGGGTGGGEGGLMSSFLQKRDGSGGYGQAGLGMLQGLGSLYLGMQQYKLAKDSLAFQKESYNKDYSARVKNYNSSIEDRQAARVASNSGAYESVGSYMDKNRLS